MTEKWSGSEAAIFERKTGFDGLRPLLAARCTTLPGRDAVEEMAFDTDFYMVRRRLEATAEMLAVVEGPEPLPLGDLADMHTLLASIRIPGSGTSPEELLEVRRLIAAFHDVAAFFSRGSANEDDDDETPAPKGHLATLAAMLPELPHHLRLIDRVIDRHGNVRDSASETLADIRRELRGMSGRVDSIMRRVMAAAVAAGYVASDATPAMRDGRLVIPVAPAHKRRVNGIVHDESASGRTVFIEPAEVVEHNNRIRELQMEERREIGRIMAETAAALRPDIDMMLDGYADLGQLDFIRAKAILAQEEGACLPTLHEGPELEWYRAVHPMLRRSIERHGGAGGKHVVPLDITLSAQKRILIISGPNAGGKSVCLKTVGTLQYMLQCGLLPPVASNSHFGIFDRILLDIGDDQSIEDDLSTYAAHLRHMKEFLRDGSPASLLLIDEFGGGTEPQIGGAIAQAILQRLNEKEVWGVITTHFQNLKHLADSTPGLVNGSMLYDRHLMQPMFMLSIGSPGSSFALEIARKTGLPADVLDNAKEIVGSDYVNLDNYLLDITRDRRYWQQKRAQIKTREKELADKIKKYEERDADIKSRRQALLAEAREEARRILAGANAAVERTISDIKAANAEKEATREARRRLRDETVEATRRVEKDKARARAASPARPQTDAVIEKGDRVKLDGTGTPGSVMHVRGREATVAFGLLQTKVDVGRLTIVEKAPKGQAAKVMVASSDDARRRQLQFRQELDVRGMRVDEALQAVTYFIDDAIQFQQERVRILHGTGTGALRQAIREMLAGVAGVAKFHDEDVRLGGAGITVVTLA